MVRKTRKVIEVEEDAGTSKVIPVTLLSGFLGSGKTTLLKQILESNEHKLKIAVVVNDMAELNIDAALIEKSGLVQAKQEIISLQNGCICCTLRGDLIREIKRIKSLNTFDYIVIESTGIAEPQAVAESFCVDPNTEMLADTDEQMLWKQARLDTCVTVIDAYNFRHYTSSLKRFKDKFNDGFDENADDGEGDKSIANLLVDQVEFANVILLNKVDLVSDDEQNATIAMIQALNPKAKIVPTKFGQLDMATILNTNLFSMEEAQKSPGWLQSLITGTEHSEVDEYGITSFVYKAEKPFHPLRIYDWCVKYLHFVEDWTERSRTSQSSSDSLEKVQAMEQQYGVILRSKGFCWIAGRDDTIGEWSQSGQLVSLIPLKPWYKVLPEEEWDLDKDDDIENIRTLVSTKYGDRRQELVFIGMRLKTDSIISDLDKCLLTSDEMIDYTDMSSFSYYDRLPPWIANYSSPGMLMVILRPGQVHKFSVGTSYCVQLSNVALNVVDDTNVTVQLWLDPYESSGSVLLATLRTNTCEQISMNITLQPNTDSNSYRTIRLKVMNAGMKRNRNDSISTTNENIELHITGTITPINNIDMQSDDACGDGTCDDDEDDK